MPRYIKHPHAAMTKYPYRVSATIVGSTHDAKFKVTILVACVSLTSLNNAVKSAVGGGWTVTQWEVA
jgi:hypothetical protein